MQLPMAAIELVPHRPPMLLVDTLVQARAKGGEALAELRRDNPFLGEGGLFHEAGFIELAAQTVAALKGYEALSLGRDVGEGFLVGVQAFSCLKMAGVGDMLRVSVTSTGGFDGFEVVEAEVRRGDEILAQGRIKLYAPEPGQSTGEEQ